MSIEENGHTNSENGEGSARHDSTAEHSFDDVARGVATGTVTRGKALRVVVASLFGGAFVATAGAAGAAPKPGGTGCPKPGQVRDPANKGQCVCASGLTTCVNKSCIDP